MMIRTLRFVRPAAAFALIALSLSGCGLGGDSQVTSATHSGAEDRKELSGDASDLLKAALSATVLKTPPSLTTSSLLTGPERTLIEGEDLDSNGIRDDIDRLLKKSTRVTGEQRMALAQSFRAGQAALLVDLGDDAAVNEARNNLLDGWQCVAQNFGFEGGRPGIIQFLATIEDLQNNTPERKNRYENLGCDSIKVMLVDAGGRAQLKKKPCSF